MKKQKENKYNLERAPVVTLLGHVDHGKTSILDSIRGTKLQSCEAGGITQSIRAHQVIYKAKDGNTYPITFIDTPGHEAFSEMRSRGANVTDIALLVVAVDDGVQPQTKEAIKYIKEAKVPVIVAINKTDLSGHDKNKIKRELANEGIQSEDQGGEVVFVEVSAKKKKGLSDLQESILLIGELNQLKSKKPDEGIAEVVVLESTTDKSQGPISFCLVKSGKLKIGSYAGWENKCTTIRAIMSENFCSVKSAKESEPVWLSGFREELPIGVSIHVYDQQKDYSKKCLKKTIQKAEINETFDEEALAQLIKNREDTKKPELNIVIKSESQGTLEAAIFELSKISNKEVSLNTLETGTGEISEDDILKAKASSGIVIGFKSKINKKIEKIAKQEKVLVKNYEIIYDLIDELNEVILSLIEPEEKEVEVARAEILKTFELSDGTNVAGCKVLSGTVLKGYQCFVESEENKKKTKLGYGKITSLKYKKDEVREASKGTECGIIIEPKIDLTVGDNIVCYKIEKE